MTCLTTIIVATKSMSSYTSLKACSTSLSTEGHIYILHFLFMKLFIVESANKVDIGARLVIAAGNEKIAR